ncbi:hypothetical protein AURDEDRAFT_115708 [Auricularia subglabra TFB-10046 SS5]|uniref:F-box domain-containing protein n=1 Tax=Auricularia subglabra (strain TFB-10046 / SS5) TaxID=717982 RepID=J0DCT8_AURST|nr:hypothetical protein AURDEDRAFT_115708 [Auricularia subglabra TFB-10046 SS5]
MHDAEPAPAAPAFERAPEEVWRVIIAFAASYVQDTHYTMPWRRNEPAVDLGEAAGHTYLWDRVADVRRGTLSLMLVCKAWHDLAIPYFYTTLSVSSHHSIFLLANRLEASRELRKHGLGWWTREIIVLLPSHSDDEAKRDAVSHSMARVVRCCPHLEAYVSFAGGMFAEPREIMAALPNTLRHLHWTASGPGFHSWRQVLARAGDLRTLGMTTLYIASNLVESAPPCLSHLHTLSLNGGAPGCEGLFKALTSGSLPVLTALSITMPLHPWSSAAALAFFERYGAQLRSLTILGGLGTRNNMLDRLLQLCPHLAALSFSINQRYALGMTPRPAHPTVRDVAVQSSFEVMSGLRAEHLERWRETLGHFDASRFPALRKLKFASLESCILCPEACGSDAIVQFWRAQIEEADARGIILEDARGRRVRIGTPHVSHNGCEETL